MIMTSQARKFALTAHVIFSVGWLGAVAGFLALAIAGLSGQNPQTVRAVYLATQVITWYVIVPLSFASLLTGLVQSLGTTWGLFRHYWVLAKLLINVLATILLLVHTMPIGELANIARETALSGVAAGRLQIQLVVDAGLALFALLVATALGVYKPRGLTPYGWRKQLEERAVSPPVLAPSAREPIRRSQPRWVFVTEIVAIHFVVLFVILHLTGHGLGGH
ncbi:MAG: hypothetical protein AUJ01_04985 [Acidobacteria bacterium 13_1_40CM_3_65_5]|nr:MAG: hypothetical protein AUH41_12250 [Gemmatimonadetes bacterium 13_1_40CM_66_11]OLD19997.1 MAG: hypothetical protein AUJ01_04985 [Acidobacteria bacterium 13_1_40CM_3_65_5]